MNIAASLRRRSLIGAAVAGACGIVRASPLGAAQCIAPAKPGGGFDLSCKLARAMLADAGLTPTPLAIRYLPGGIGAIAFHQTVSERPAEAGTLIAFSGGSLLNLAQGRFGRYGAGDVRWVAAIGIDYGAVVVRRDSPLHTLTDLVAALRRDLQGLRIGAGGTVGSQDWIKTALIAQAAGIDHKGIRFVAFEGGGDALQALQGGHVQAVSGDAAEVSRQIAAGAPLRVLVVLADQRLPGLPDVPTAREQGIALSWPAVRGFYVGPKVSDADYRAWVEAFSTAMAAPGFAARRAEFGLYPFALTGSELDAYVRRTVAEYRQLALRLKLPLRE